MTYSIPPSELVLNSDGSIYHLHLHPGEVGDTVILVGDQARVPLISQHFDRIDTVRQHREFLTHTGELGAKRLTVVSTGIGMPNIDIVLNELDALVNIDLKARVVKPMSQAMTICRVGTCGGLSRQVRCGDVVASTMAASVSRLMSFYAYTQTSCEQAFSALVSEQLGVPIDALTVASATMDEPLPASFHQGYTFTCNGFYGPQGRQLRLPVRDTTLLQRLQSLQYQSQAFLNFEMETAAILALAGALGHRAASLSVVLADRVRQQFAENPNKMIDQLIRAALDWLVG